MFQVTFFFDEIWKMKEKNAKILAFFYIISKICQNQVSRLLGHWNSNLDHFQQLFALDEFHFLGLSTDIPYFFNFTYTSSRQARA